MTDATSSDGQLELSIKAKERAVEILRAHFAEDHISLAEYERRLDVAYAARSQAELAALLSDLPELPGVQAIDLFRAKSPAPVRKRQFSFNVLGISERRGRWSPPRRLVITTLMGGVLLDFREAALATDEVDVTVVSLVGTVEILVPPTLRVEMGGVPIIGAFEHRSEGASPEPSAPLLRVNGVALVGAVEVKVLPTGEAYRPDW